MGTVLPTPLKIAADSVPAGRYAVGVSGGADSVALLHLMHNHRPDLHLHVVHLDHETRGAESRGDAAFVRQLADAWRLPCTMATRSEVEPLLVERPANPSALYRAMRLELFQRVAAECGLDTVLLAHHADDQAETILHRLLRGSGISGLGGIAGESRHGNLLQGGSNGAAATTPSPALPRSTGRGGKSGPLLIRRPLLGVPGRLLREYLRDERQAWREDASNQSGQYMRNRLRRVLADEPDLADALRDVGRSCETLRRWVQSAAPVLPEAFDAALLCDLSPLLAHESARRWLVARGVPPAELLPAVAQRLIDMATDAAAPPRQHFPGRVLVRRSHGRIEAV